MDTQAQMQAIVDKIAGRGAEPPPLSALDEPWRTIYRRVRRCGDFTEAEMMLYAITRKIRPRGDSAVDEGWLLAHDLVDMMPHGDTFTAYPSLGEMKRGFADVRWLWPGWIPRGMVTLLGAAPGMGKSLLALDLARRIIVGDPWPDGQAGLPPRDHVESRVLIVDAEGAPALLNQRAAAWDMDEQKLFLLTSPQPRESVRLAGVPRSPAQSLHPRDGPASGRPAGGWGARRRSPRTKIPSVGRGKGGERGSHAGPWARERDDGGDGLIDLAGPRYQELLREMCHDLQPALVVVDSLAAATSRGETSIEGSRAILGFLTGLARDHDMGMLVIHHLRKRAGGSRARFRPAADDLRGSSHLSAAARSVLAMSMATSPPGTATWAVGDRGEILFQGPGYTGPRRLEVVKTNLCRLPPALEVVLEGGDGAVPSLRYAQASPDEPPPTQTALCARWLLDHLAAAAEPQKPAEVVRAAQEAGFTRFTLYRARRALAGAIVDIGRNPNDPQKRWALAEIGGHTASGKFLRDSTL